jgi:hypothetical protein
VIDATSQPERCNSNAGGIGNEQAIVKGDASTLSKKAACILGTPSISDVPT